MSISKKPTDTPEEVTVTLKISKSLHVKLTAIAVSEGKSLTAKLAQAAREHAAGYERTTKTVSAYARKKAAK